MSKILDKHKKSNIRFQEGDLILYEPSLEQRKEIQELIQSNSKIDKNLDVTGKLEFKSIRFIIRELTSIGAEIDEMTDEEVKISFDNGDRQLELLINAISDLINELADDMFNNIFQQTKLINSYLNIINGNKDIEKMKEKVNRLFKKNKINMTFDDLKNLFNGNEEDIKNLINKITTNK